MYRNRVTAQATNRPERRGPRILGRRLTRRAGLIGAAVISLGGLLLAAAPAASATSLSGLPSIGCYRTASGGTIQGTKLVVNDDGGTTTYAAYVYRWNGSWVEVGPMYTSDGHWLQTFYDSALGSLSEQPVSLTVPHGYYQVVYYFRTTGDSGTQYANAEVITPSTSYNLYTCQL